MAGGRLRRLPSGATAICLADYSGSYASCTALYGIPDNKFMSDDASRLCGSSRSSRRGQRKSAPTVASRLSTPTVVEGYATVERDRGASGPVRRYLPNQRRRSEGLNEAGTVVGATDPIRSLELRTRAITQWYTRAGESERNTLGLAAVNGVT